MTVKFVQRGLLITAVAGVVVLASQPLASAAIQPAAIPAPASIVQTAPAVPGGGTVDSGKGIVKGAVAGITPVFGLPTVSPAI